MPSVIRTRIKFLSFGILFFLGFSAMGQFGEFAGTGRIVDTDINANPLGFVTEVDISEYTPMEGSPYFKDKWALTNLYAKNGTKIENIYTKINFHNYTIEIKSDGLVRTLKIDVIDHLVLNVMNENYVFQNASKFFHNGESGIPLVGFSQVLYSGGDNYSLIKLIKTKIIKSTHNKALDLGKKEDKIVLEPSYFIIDNLNIAYPIAIKNRRKFHNSLPLPVETKKEVQEYLKSEKLHPKKEEDLIKIMGYLNSL